MTRCVHAVLVLALASSACARERVFESFEPVSMTPRAKLDSWSAAWCGECHKAIYEEWQRSAMGRASTNEVFLAEWAAPANGRSELCFKCHAPLQRQQPRILTGLQGTAPPVAEGHRNPGFDANLHREGVTCVACHIQEGQLVGPEGKGAPATAPTGDMHGFGKSPLIGSSELCGECHQFDGHPFARLRRPLADVVGEWERWRDGGGGDESCVDCHMPPIERPNAEGAEIRHGRQHTFRGPDDLSLLREGVNMTVAARETLDVTLDNQAGHGFPTGEPARAVELRIDFIDDAGARLVREQRWLERIIELPRVRERSDSTLEPLESRRFAFEIPPGAATADVRLSYHRTKNLPEVEQALQLGDLKIEHRTVELAEH